MAKEREQKIGRIMYVEQGKTAQEICPLISVSEATFSKWVNKYSWRDQRNARLCNPAIRTENIRQLINDLSEQRLSLGRELKEAEASADADRVSATRKNIAQVDDAVSKWNKTLENIDTENRISLSTYIAVMELIFDSIRAHNEKLYIDLIDFQEIHLNEIAIRFK